MKQQQVKIILTITWYKAAEFSWTPQEQSKMKLRRPSPMMTPSINGHVIWDIKVKWQASPPCLTTRGEGEQKREKQNSSKSYLSPQITTKNKDKTIGSWSPKTMKCLPWAACFMQPHRHFLSFSSGSSVNNCGWRTWELETLISRELCSWGSGEPVKVWWCRLNHTKSCCRQILRNSLKQVWIAKCSFSG